MNDAYDRWARSWRVLRRNRPTHGRSDRLAVVRVEAAGPADVARVGATLASAFAGDPFYAWLTPSRNRVERLRRLFSAVAASSLRWGHVCVTEDDACAAIWLPPRRWQPPVTELVRLLPRYARDFGLRLPRVLRVSTRLEQRHPELPAHWYLESIGTRPELQGRGIGSAVMESVLSRCDEDVLPVYLEATGPENVRFYERHGFEVVEELSLAGGPPVWRMWRAPPQQASPRDDASHAEPDDAAG